MEQPLLPEVKPYVNRSLFSDLFLRELLPQDKSWQVEEHQVRLAMQAALNLYAPRKDELPQRNEAQLEQEFVRPLLEALGHHFEVQPSLPTSEGVRRPDYAFFATDEDKAEALRKHQGELSYFKRAIAIGDAKQWGRSLDKRQRVGTDKFDMLSPSWQIDYYLRMSEVPWGILTDGRFWRLYSRDTSFRLDVHYQIDLPQLLAQPDIEAFKYFYLFFRRQAFVTDVEGLCFLDRVYQGSLEYAREVGDDLKENVYRALRLLAEGFLETRGNDLDPVRDLEAIHENSLVYLYRLLFINYAEDRRLLPRDTRLYRETYGLVSMEGEIASRMERRESPSRLQATYWERLDALFDLINHGSEAFGVEQDTLFVPPYNGGLFDPQRHPFLERNKVADRWLAPVIDLLARSKGEGAGRAFVDYSSLDVRHLGSIYEGLLEYKLRVAQEERVAVKRRRREEWVPADEAEGKRIVERVKAGGLYLATDRGERKATGSYYTPDYIVKYIVEHTVGPLIEERMKEDDPIRGILSLKVLDPAMGSGHFLVEATDRLAHALVEALGESGEEPEEEDVRWARREVVERCIYGVDLNPLAVELAKLSLWLHTVAEGKPLNFLDHHFKAGNSLIGAWVEDLGSLPVRRKRGKAKEPEQAARQMNLFEIRLTEKLRLMLKGVLDIIRRGSETLEDIKAKVAADEAVEELKAPFKAVANLWVSTYFGNEVAEAEYQEALEHIGEPDQLLSLPAIERGRQIGEDKRFFHWELEFPEAFYEDSKRRENPGFDAVVGNPPWISFGLRGVGKLDRAEDAFYRDTFSESAQYKLSIYAIFMQAATATAMSGGYHAFIVPDSFLLGQYFSRVRQYILDNAFLHKIVLILEDFWPAGDVGRSVVYVVQKQPRQVTKSHNQLTAVLAETLDDFVSGNVLSNAYEQAVFERAHLNRFRLFFDDRVKTIIEQLELHSKPLSSVVKFYSGLIAREGQRRIIIRGRPADYSESRYGKLVESSGYLDRYGLEFHDCYVAKRKELYKSGYDPAKYENPKILLNQTGDSLKAALDDEGYFCLNNMHIGYSVNPEYDLRFITSLLCSKLLNFYYQKVSLEQGRAMAQMDIETVDLIPIRGIFFVSTQRERHVFLQEGSALAERLRPHLQRSRIQTCYSDFLESDLGQWTTTRLEAKPEQSGVIHDLLAYLAEHMIQMNKKKQAETKGFLDWLAGYTGLPIEDWRLKTRVKAYWEHGWDEVRRALRQNRKVIEEASGRDVESREGLEAIQREFDQSVARLEPLLERIASTDRLIDLIVYRLYGLTEEEVAIVEESVAS